MSKEYSQTLRDIGPVAWCEGAFGWITEDGQPITLTPWQRATLEAYWQHREECTTLAISNTKKTGKTLLDAVLTAWRWLALPGVHFAAGNDLDQASSRVFSEVVDMVKRNSYLSANVKIGKNELVFNPTGSKLIALAVDAAGNAGANHLTVSHTAAWGIIYENGIRSWEELTPPPGKKYGFPALRIADSYAGFGESKTWHELVDRGLKGERISQEWPIYRAGGLIIFHAEGAEARERCFRGSKEEAAAYYADQQSSLRPNAFTRMHGNQRTSSESAFIPYDRWEACYSAECRPVQTGDRRKLILGADASTSHDLTALVGVSRDPKNLLTRVVFTQVWKPQKILGIRVGKATVDLEETIGETVLRLHAAGMVEKVICDPYQLHTLIVKWEKAGIRIVELAQNAGRVDADQALYTAILGGNIQHYNDPILNEHVKNAVAVETPRGFRLAKEKTSLKIDAAVALSMANWGALEANRRGSGIAEVGPSVYDYDQAEWDEFRRSLLPHPPGVTYANCKIRRKNPTYGCQACKDETSEWYDQYGFEKINGESQFPEGAHIDSGNFDGMLQRIIDQETRRRDAMGLEDRSWNHFLEMVKLEREKNERLY